MTTDRQYIVPAEVPSAEELQEMYGYLHDENSAVTQVSLWGLPNSSDKFNPKEVLERLVHVHEAFNRAEAEIF